MNTRPFISLMSMLLCLTMGSISHTVLAHGNIHERLNEVETRLNNQPSLLPAHLEYVTLLLEHHEFTRAHIAIDKTKKAIPHFEDYDYYKALIHWRHALTLSEPQQAEHIKHAELALKRFVNKNALSANAHLLLARIHGHQLNYTQSAFHYNRATQLKHKNHAGILHEYVAVLLALNKTELASKLIQQAIDNDRSDRILLDAAIQNAVAKGDYATALHWMNAYPETEKTLPSSQIKRAQLLELLGKTKEAHTLFCNARKTLKQLPAHVLASPRITELMSTTQNAAHTCSSLDSNASSETT